MYSHEVGCNKDGHAFAEMLKKPKKGSGAEMLSIQPRYKSEDNNITIWLFTERNETNTKKNTVSTNQQMVTAKLFWPLQKIALNGMDIAVAVAGIVAQRQTMTGGGTTLFHHHVRPRRQATTALTSLNPAFVNTGL